MKKIYIISLALFLIGCNEERTDYIYPNAIEEANKYCVKHGGVQWYKLTDGHIVRLRCNNKAIIDNIFIKS
jgi:hypothetical protein